MRKKSKKKQIVAMTLALSVPSSSVGMCGASAAEAPPLQSRCQLAALAAGGRAQVQYCLLYTSRCV